MGRAVLEHRREASGRWGGTAAYVGVEDEVVGRVERDRPLARRGPAGRRDRIAATLAWICAVSQVTGSSPTRPEHHGDVGAVPLAGLGQRAEQVDPDPRDPLEDAPAPGTVARNRCAARQGPIVCELDGPTPILKMSKVPTVPTPSSLRALSVRSLSLSIVPYRGRFFKQPWRGFRQVLSASSSPTSAHGHQ